MDYKISYRIKYGLMTTAIAVSATGLADIMQIHRNTTNFVGILVVFVLVFVSELALDMKRKWND